MFTIR